MIVLIIHFNGRALHKRQCELSRIPAHCPATLMIWAVFDSLLITAISGRSLPGLPQNFCSMNKSPTDGEAASTRRWRMALWRSPKACVGRWLHAQSKTFVCFLVKHRAPALTLAHGMHRMKSIPILWHQYISLWKLKAEYLVTSAYYNYYCENWKLSIFWYQYISLWKLGVEGRACHWATERDLLWKRPPWRPNPTRKETSLCREET